ncbi:RNA polymerase sigma factor [Sphingobacterium faecale]|uniref:RNA polymerase sigma-70 factor n=1 Tax=Sphingobacterium faecale TaxID=2803775 RepID=A0ABS1R6C8_9SPHI|nr:RNA polymerase sigma-70 factor [Sphingobacterium faecale]MBL1410208.1 RNA polymerase sigma-70 factor [Sphingobacterium faecale]
MKRSRKTPQSNKAVEEHELLLQLKSGDIHAFEELYHRYKSRLAGKFLQLLKSEVLAQDALQDLFAKVWDVRATIDIEQSFPAFLYRIATNLAHSIFRRASLESSPRTLLKIGYTEAYSHVEEDLFQKERVKIVEDAIAKLPERQRQVFVMHKIEGKSYKEIAEELNISLSAINNHITRANKFLSENLEPKIWFILLALSSNDYFDFF